MAYHTIGSVESVGYPCRIKQYKGFYDLYQIDTADENDSDQERSGRATGLNSPWGMRGAILARFGWTYDYLLWGISWRNVCLMMADAPGYEYEDKKKKKPKGKDLKSKLESIGWDFNQIK